MMTKTLILVSLRVDTEKEAEFNDFYHHSYIPKLMQIIPEIESARRFQEHNVDGTLRYYDKQFLTIYECASEEQAQKALDAIKSRPGREKEKDEWQKWQTNHLRNVLSASLYTQCYAHPRTTWDGNFGSRPFFMVSVETREQEERFDNWYETIYLPKNLADVPTWAACRRYQNQTTKSIRKLTIYEAWDLAGLQHSLELMRAPHRLKENASWKQWDQGENPVIIWEDATSFAPIFRYPY